MSPFVGNTIRGAIGATLDKMGSPAYKQAFKIDATDSIPNPYAISTPYASKTYYYADDTLGFTLTLFGNGCKYGEDFTAAAKEMCRGKLNCCTLDSYQLEYDRVWSDAGAEGIAPCNEVLIRFLTPTEILSSKQAIFEIDFETFVNSLFGRISTIIDNYTDSEFILPYILVAKKPFITAKYNIEPINFQTNGQPINAFVGTAKYTGNVTRYLPYIDLGSQIHIGKKTTRACGQYCFEI